MENIKEKICTHAHCKCMSSTCSNFHYATCNAEYIREQRTLEEHKKNSALIEKLAEIEHDQWITWSKSLVDSEKRLSMNRIERWKKLWRPYSDLTEEEKEQDRIYARKVLVLLMREGKA